MGNSVKYILVNPHTPVIQLRGLFKPQCYTVNVLFSLHARSDFQLNDYMQFISSARRVIVYQHFLNIFPFLVPVKCMVTACNMRVVYARYACVILQSL